MAYERPSDFESRLQERLDKAMHEAINTLIDVAQCSDDDKARVSAANAAVEFWKAKNHVGTGGAAPGSGVNLTLNVNQLRDTLSQAHRAIQHSDPGAALDIGDTTLLADPDFLVMPQLNGAQPQLAALALRQARQNAEEAHLIAPPKPPKLPAKFRAHIAREPESDQEGDL